MEEDFHTDQEYEINSYESDVTENHQDWWYIDSKTGEQLERPEPKPVQLEKWEKK